MARKIKIDLTNFFGDSKTITFDNIENAKQFVALYPTRISKHQKVKIKCDALALDGWISGEL